ANWSVETGPRDAGRARNDESRSARPCPMRSAAALGSALAAFTGAAALGAAAPQPQPGPRRPPRKKYQMRKSINLWAFPYPQRVSLKQSPQLPKDAGFEGIELNYDLENDLSPRRGARDYRALRKTAENIGIAISGLCSFLYWPYSLTSN